MPLRLSLIHIYLVKLPAILSDLAAAYLVYRLAKGRFGKPRALMLCGLMAFNPMTMLDSALWGQIDSILTLLAVGALYCYLKGKKPWSAALFVIGVLVKPQMLVFGPLLAAAFVYDIVKAPKKGLREMGVSALAGIAALLIIALPFSFGQEPLWLLHKYTVAAGSYPYATVNAFNLYALFGGNWLDYNTELILGITIKQFGTVMIAVSYTHLDVYKRQVLGSAASAHEDSFSDGLLEYPQYTRPSEFRGMRVPEILLSGDHQKIAQWRREQSLQVTKQKRPDLLETAPLTEKERNTYCTKQ